jgi:wobble nucleotide-excising tRNase
LVYNRDFVDANFNMGMHLKGIFTLGAEDIANEHAIVTKKEEVDRYVREIAQCAKTLGSDTQAMGKLAELAEVEAECKERCWAQKRKHDELFSEAFVGVRNDSARFKERLVAQAQSNMAQPQTLEYLTERARTVFGPTPQRHSRIPTVNGARILDHEANPILAKKVLGKHDVDIAAMIHRLGHSDWVKVGQALYEESAPHCPFCQQPVHYELKVSLEEYFDEGFERDTRAILALQAAYDYEANSLSSVLQAVANSTSPFLDKVAFAQVRTVLEAKLLANALILANKSKEPSVPQILDPLGEALAALCSMIESANTAVVQHNNIVDSIGSEKTMLVAQVWRYILDDMQAYLDVYERKRNGLSAAVTNLRRQITLAEAAKTKAERELRELEKSATTVQPTVDAINHLLTSFGFKTFSLAKADNDTHYKLIRQNGQEAKDSLSEGEKSFVTFLYFYHLIKGSISESGAARDRIVVFDDPVSSMDSDVLFIVSSLIRAVFDDMKHGRGYVKQVFVLTHNVYFHKEVCFSATSSRKVKDKGAKSTERTLGRTYWLVRKLPGGPKLEQHIENPIKTTYELLWDEIRREEKNSLTIQNTMRRILEHYFKILGGVDFDDLCENFEGREKLVCRSLLSWVNDGSHFSHDDAHFAFGQDAIEEQVIIFKKIFERAEHLPHYEMMMARN